MSRNLWNDIINGIDERNIDDAIELLEGKSAGKAGKAESTELTEIKITGHKPSRLMIFRDILCTAAAVAILIGAGFFINRMLSGTPPVSPSETTAISAAAGANRFTAYDFGAYSDPIVYSRPDDRDTAELPDEGGDIKVPGNRYDLVSDADNGVVVTIKSSAVTEKLFPAAANECTAEVHYTAFGDIEGTKNISVFTYPKSWKKDLEIGADYFLLLAEYPKEENSYKVCGLSGVFKINDDLTVTPLSSFDAAQNYSGLSLADLVHDLTEAFAEVSRQAALETAPKKVTANSVSDTNGAVRITYEEDGENSAPPSGVEVGFSVPGFPETSFVWTSESVSADGTVLFSGYPVESVYLSDLNGDGIPEICSDVYIGFGIIRRRIFVYDLVSRRLYELSGPFRNTDCFISERHGTLWIKEERPNADKYAVISDTKLEMSFFVRVVPDDVRKGFRIIMRTQPCWVHSQPDDYVIFRDGSYISLITGKEADYNDIFTNEDCDFGSTIRKKEGEALLNNNETTFPQAGEFYGTWGDTSFGTYPERCAILVKQCPTDLYSELLTKYGSAVPRDEYGAGEVMLVYGCELVPNEEMEEFYGDMPKFVIETGTPFTKDELVPFEMDLTRYSYMDDWDERKKDEEPYISMSWTTEWAFFAELGRPEIAELYKRAKDFDRSNDNRLFSKAATSKSGRRARMRALKKNGNGDYYYNYFVESGFTFESFYNAYLETYTKEDVEEFFANTDLYTEYDGQLWFTETAKGGPIGYVKYDYEMITDTDEELVFRCTIYSSMSDLEYVPEHEDMYTRICVEYRFVNTEDGWRIDYFGKFISMEKPDDIA